MLNNCRVILFNVFPVLSKGWEESLLFGTMYWQDDKGLPKETAIMSWLGEEAIKEAASHGFKAVTTPYSHVYLDIT